MDNSQANMPEHSADTPSPGETFMLDGLNTPAEKPTSQWLAYARNILYVLLCLTILGFIGRMFWWADYFAHPRLHLAVALCVIAAIFILTFDWVRVIAALVGIGLNMLAVTTSIAGTNNITNAMAMPAGQLRVITVNVSDLSPQSPVLIRWLTSLSPDIVVLVSANHAWLPTLDKLIGALPYQKMADHTTDFGMAILSRFPMDRTESSVAGPMSLPTLTAEMETPIGRIAIMGVHPNPPGDGASTRARDLYLAQLAAIAQTTSMPTLLVGDFNATPWSSGFETIRNLPNLQPASMDIPATWPAELGPMGLPTEHILLSIPYNKPRDIIFSTIKAGPALPGLSHLPLLATLAVRERR